MDRAAFAALSALTFVIPWENIVTFPGFGSMARLAGVITGVLAVTSILLSGALRRPVAFHVLATSFLLWSALTVLWTINYEATRVRAITYFQVVVLAWLVWQVARTHSRQVTLLQAYVLGAYVSAGVTLKNYLLGSVWLNARYSAAGFNPNELAMILVLALPMAWYLALSAQRRSVALLNASYLPLAMVAILLTASRGAFITLLIALLVVPWSLQRLSVGARVGMVALAAASMVIVGAIVPQTSWDRIGETAGNIEKGDLSKREILWQAGFELFTERPVLGFGAGTFQYATQPFGAEVAPHQTFLSVLTGQGLVGLTLFLGALAAAFSAIPRMHGLERKVWIVLAFTLFVGLLPRTWDYAKPPWFVLSLLTAQAAVSHDRSRRSDG